MCLKSFKQGCKPETTCRIFVTCCRPAHGWGTGRITTDSESLQDDPQTTTRCHSS